MRLTFLMSSDVSAVDSGGAGGARAPPEFGGSEKGRSLISAYRSLAITTDTPGFKKLSTALRSIVYGHKKTQNISVCISKPSGCFFYKKIQPKSSEPIVSNIIELWGYICNI